MIYKESLKFIITRKGLIFVLCSLFLFFAFSAQAQDVKFYVYPLKLEMPVSPGESLTEEIKILNQGSELLNIRTYVMDYEIDENNEFTFFPPGYESYSAASWISLDKADFSISTGEEETLEVTMTIPEETEPGGHFAIIFFESVGSIEPGKSGVVVQGRIGTVVLQSSPGEEKEEGYIKSFTIPKYFFPKSRSLLWGEREPLPWEMVFHNSGNVHLNIENTIDFLNWRGKSVHKTEPQRITTLPNTDRKLKGEWEEMPAIGRFTAICKVAYVQGKLETKTISFYIIPIKTLIIIGIALVLLILLIVFIYKLGQRRAKTNKMPCPKCKKSIDKDSLFCPYCGEKIKGKVDKRKNKSDDKVKNIAKVRKKKNK